MRACKAQVLFSETPRTAALRQNAFRQLWSLKESLVKARGDGLANELGRADFQLSPCGSTATVQLDGTPQPCWCVHLASRCCNVLSLNSHDRAFNVQQLGRPGADGAHWVCTPRRVCDEAQLRVDKRVPR